MTAKNGQTAHSGHYGFTSMHNQNRKCVHIGNEHGITIKSKLCFDEKIRRMTRHSLSTIPAWNDRPSYEIGLEGLAQIMDTSRSIVVRFIWILVILICFSICMFQFYNCTSKYFEEPIAVDVEIREAETLQFPSVSLTNTESKGLYEMWKEYLNDSEKGANSMEGCITPAKYLIKEVYGLNTDEMWKRLNTTTTLRSLELSARGKIYPVHVTENPGFVAMQTQLQSEKMFPYGGVQTKVLCKIDKLLDGCTNSQIVGSLQPYGMPSDLRTTWTFTSLTLFELLFTVQKYEFVSRRTSPCVSFEQYLECRAQCSIRAFKDFPCRFPFVPPEVTLPPCKTGGQNMSIIYRDSLILIARMPCDCPRLCRDSSFRVGVSIFGQSETETIIGAYFQNNLMTVIKERFSYDITSLLSDIGGNLGLCLGFSILTIFQFIQGLWKSRKSRNGQQSKTKHPQLFRADPIVCQVNRILRYELKCLKGKCIQSKEGNLPIVGLSTVMNSNASPILRIVWLSVIITCFLGYCLFGYIRIISYFSEPTHMEVNVTKADVVHFPNLTVCGNGILGIKILQRLARKTKQKLWRFSDQNRIHYWCSLQLIDMLQIPVLNATKAWNSMSVFEEFDRATSIGEFVAGYQFLTNVTWRPVYMPEGKCIEYFIGKQKYAGTNTMFSRITMSKVDYTFHEQLKDCDRSYNTVYLTPPNTNLHLSQRLIYPKLAKSSIIMDSNKVTYLNLWRKPCADPSIANECSAQCFEKILFSQVTCRLPYMPDHFNLTFCSNLEEGRAAHNTYMDIALTFDAVKHSNCSCLPTCETVLMNPVLYNEPLDLIRMTVLVNLFFTNIQQHMIEVRTDSLSQLLCDLGGNLGLALGVSLLSIFDMIQTILAGFFQYVCGGRKAQKKTAFTTAARLGPPPVKHDVMGILKMPNTGAYAYTLKSTTQSFDAFQHTTAIAHSKMTPLKKKTLYY